jgi:aspartate-semialdehyde dehydrogenase
MNKELPKAHSLSGGKRKVAVLGATGLVGRRLVSLLLNHPQFVLTAVVGSAAAEGKSYKAVWQEKEKALQQHYGDFWRPFPFPPSPEGIGRMRISSFEELQGAESLIVFSSIPERAGEFEEALIRRGHIVFSNSSYRRFDPTVPLVVPEVNRHALGGAQFVKNPNCVTSGLILILAALDARYGLREVVVATYQSLSGRGDAKYARDLVLGNILPLHASPERTEENIRGEVKKILGEAFRISVTCNRVCVQEGHYVEVRIKTRTPIGNSEEAADILSSFNPLEHLQLRSNPKSPIVVLRENGRPRPMQDANHHEGMAIAVGNLTTEDEVFDLRLTYVVNNLVRGAAGAALLNAELWEAGATALSAGAND